MGFGEAVRTCLTKYATFSGRASRAEYWWFMVFLFLGEGCLGIVDAQVFGPGTAVLTSLFFLMTLIPWFAVGWRRMHDTGRSGLHFVYPLIVMVGTGSFAAFADTLGSGPLSGGVMIILVAAVFVFAISPLLVLWWLTRPSEPHANRYGHPPPR